MSPTSPSSVVQLVDADGAFHASDLADLATATGLNAAGRGYQVVAVMGPQSSGKSTLLNALVREKEAQQRACASSQARALHARR